MKNLLLLALLFLASCGSTSRMADWDGTGTYYGEVVEMHFSNGSSTCPRGMSTIVTTSRSVEVGNFDFKTQEVGNYAFTDEITTFVVCGHQDFIMMGDKVWVKENLPTTKDKHTHYAYISGYKYAIE
jgi:hypothetical protein